MPTRPRKHAGYKSLLNEANSQSLAPTDLFTDTAGRSLRLKDSTIFNSLWTADEKDKLFTALARCGKGDLMQVSRRVGSKSLVEVTAYVGLLDEEMEWRKKRAHRKRDRVFDYARMPAAVEVADKWLELEEKCAAKLAAAEDETYESEGDEGDEEDIELDEDSVFDVEQANELASWFFFLSRILSDPTRYASMFNQRHYSSQLSADTIRNLDNLARSLTKQLIHTILTFIVPPHHQSHSLSPSRSVSVSDVRTAIDLLSLPRHFRTHFSELPSRMRKLGGSVDILNHYHEVYRKEVGQRGSREEVVEYVLSGRTPTISRERTHTIKPWPEKWSLQEGFEWPRTPVNTSGEKTEPGWEDSSHPMASESDMMDEETSDANDVEDTCSSIEDSLKEDELWNQATAEDINLLDSETTYLESLDSEWSQIEQQRLLLFMKEGKRASKKFQKQAIKSFTPSADTLLKQNEWKKAKKQLYSKFGRNWAVYEEEIVGVEGQGWERPPEVWELWQKRRPSVRNGMDWRESINGEGGRNGRKRKIHELEDEGSNYSE